MVTVYVDEVQEYARVAGPAKRWGRKWSHMTADTEEELHAMAQAIGLKRSYFQRRGGNPALDHYDVTPPKREAAVKRGAVQETTAQFMERLRRLRG